MSKSGQKPTDMCRGGRQRWLFDHRVGGREQSVRNGEAERLRTLAVDRQLKLGRQREIGEPLSDGAS